MKLNILTDELVWLAFYVAETLRHKSRRDDPGYDPERVRSSANNADDALALFKSTFKEKK